VDSHCYEEVCPDRSIEVPFYQYMPNPDPQMQRDGQWKGSCYSDTGKRAGGKPATELGVSRLAPENICFRKPAQSLKCDHAQGMLGGLNGSAVADLLQVRPVPLRRRPSAQQPEPDRVQDPGRFVWCAAGRQWIHSSLGCHRHR